jgi:lipoyl(octanoyl) transferase
MQWIEAGEVVYEDALAWQHRLAAARAADEIGDILVTLTHDRVYTAGRHAELDRNVLGTRDIRVVQTDRGGDVTYHGPGQLVAYPILRLDSPKAVKAHAAALEAACVRTAASFGIEAQAATPQGWRDPAGVPMTGVWVGEDKLAAVGVRVDRGVTSHGLALNVDPDLDDFTGIVPCGLGAAGVCSLASLGIETTLGEVRSRLVGHLGQALGRLVSAGSTAALATCLDDPAPAEAAVADRGGAEGQQRRASVQ